MLLENIDKLLHYINGKLDDTSDDIIPESVLFDHICRIYDIFTEKGYETDEQLSCVIDDVTSDYKEPVEGAKDRLTAALKIILIAYFCSTVGKYANNLFYEIDI